MKNFLIAGILIVLSHFFISCEVQETTETPSKDCVCEDSTDTTAPILLNIRQVAYYGNYLSYPLGWNATLTFEDSYIEFEFNEAMNQERSQLFIRENSTLITTIIYNASDPDNIIVSPRPFTVTTKHLKWLGSSGYDTERTYYIYGVVYDLAGNMTIIQPQLFVTGRK